MRHPSRPGKRQTAKWNPRDFYSSHLRRRPNPIPDPKTALSLSLSKYAPPWDRGQSRLFSDRRRGQQAGRQAGATLKSYFRSNCRVVACRKSARMRSKIPQVSRSVSRPHGGGWQEHLPRRRCMPVCKSLSILEVHETKIRTCTSKSFTSEIGQQP